MLDNWGQTFLYFLKIQQLEILRGQLLANSVKGQEI